MLILNLKKKKRNKLKKGRCIWRTITNNKIQSPPNTERLRGRKRGKGREREIEKGKEGEDRWNCGWRNRSEMAALAWPCGGCLPLWHCSIAEWSHFINYGWCYRICGPKGYDGQLWFFFFFSLEDQR